MPAEEVLEVEVAQVAALRVIGADPVVERGQHLDLQASFLGELARLAQQLGVNPGDGDNDVGGVGAFGHSDQVSAGAQDRHALDPEAALVAVIVDVGDRHEFAAVVVQHVAGEAATGQPGAIDDDATG